MQGFQWNIFLKNAFLTFKGLALYSEMCLVSFPQIFILFRFIQQKRNCTCSIIELRIFQNIWHKRMFVFFLKILGKRTQYNSSTFWRNNGILHQKSFNADPPKIWVLDLLVTFFSIIQQRLVRERAINMLYIYILTCQMSIKWWILFTACSRHEHWLKLILILQTRSDKIL